MAEQFKPGDRVEWDIVDSGRVIATKRGAVRSFVDFPAKAAVERDGDGQRWHLPLDQLRRLEEPHGPTQEDLDDLFDGHPLESFKPLFERLLNEKPIERNLGPRIVTGVPGDGPQIVTGKGATSPRASLLDEAKALVTGDRNNTYGAPTQDFQRTADALQAMGYRGPDGRALQAHDVAILVAMVKISRLMWTPQKRDSWADLAGYAACGYECAVTEVND